MKKKILIIFLFLLIAIIYTFFCFKNIIIPCPIKNLTGYDCPGCGITRMIISILKLDLYQAFRYNPLIFIMLPFIIFIIIYNIYIWLFNKSGRIIKKIPNWIYIVLIIILIIYGVLRNIDTFNYLKPTKI